MIVSTSTGLCLDNPAIPPSGKIVFLDVDGVLNSHEIAAEHYHRTGEMGFGGFFAEDDTATHNNVIWGQAQVDRLRKIVETTQAAIVISSTWRLNFSLAKFKEMFAVYGWPDAPVIDKTDSAFVDRCDEIAAWLSRHHEKVTGFVVIDDDKDAWRPMESCHFVRTKIRNGLQDNHVEAAIHALGLPVDPILISIQ